MGLVGVVVDLAVEESRGFRTWPSRTQEATSQADLSTPNTCDAWTVGFVGKGGLAVAGRCLLELPLLHEVILAAQGTGHFLGPALDAVEQSLAGGCCFVVGRPTPLRRGLRPFCQCDIHRRPPARVNWADPGRRVPCDHSHHLEERTSAHRRSCLSTVRRPGTEWPAAKASTYATPLAVTADGSVTGYTQPGRACGPRVRAASSRLGSQGCAACLA